MEIKYDVHKIGITSEELQYKVIGRYKGLIDEKDIFISFTVDNTDFRDELEYWIKRRKEEIRKDFEAKFEEVVNAKS